MIAFTIIFAITCWLGAMALLFGPERVRDVYVYLTGAELPTITGRDLAVTLALLNVAPVVLILGWSVGRRPFDRRAPTTDDDLSDNRCLRLSVLVFVLVVGLALARLASAGAFDRLDDWASYGSLVAARGAVLDETTFWDEVLVYSLVPLAGSWLLLEALRANVSGRRTLVVAAASIAAVVTVNAAVFQKRTLLTGLLLLAATVLCDPTSRRSLAPRLGRLWSSSGVALALVAVYVVYVGLLIGPELRPSDVFLSRGAAGVATIAPTIARDGFALAGQRHGGSIALAAPVAATFPSPDDVAGLSRRQVLVYQAMLGPTTRTAGPAIAYAAIYPKRHAYYDLDLGLDVLGIGAPPDDNRTSWDAIFPSNPGGLNAVPYMFALYSQGGVWVALAGSLVIGVVLAVLWCGVPALALPAQARAALMALVIVLATGLAGDAARNVILVSYGVLWPALAVFAASGLHALARMLLASRTGPAVGE